jgi:hypothetical protein
MEIKETIGIDVGKLINEVRINSNQKAKEFENTDKGISTMVQWVLRNTPFSKKKFYLHLSIQDYTHRN